MTPQSYLANRKMHCPKGLFMAAASIQATLESSKTNTGWKRETVRVGGDGRRCWGLWGPWKRFMDLGAYHVVCTRYETPLDCHVVHT